ncbi:ATP/GTP-binding protein [Streptomyces sp. RerS4]|uniref:ATP/GTP-binding protein n=1 Tax=Streptomyces sp. RerS4 TaxID=2942449 RepID=UPI00201BC0E1|nr:ATP/GTP-binding protein [Streptomyces sp. RerS4]UQW99135.1 ATP/GTP-binding protein [Streptomyces sp. RerS4]
MLRRRAAAATLAAVASVALSPSVAWATDGDVWNCDNKRVCAGVEIPPEVGGGGTRNRPGSGSGGGGSSRPTPVIDGISCAITRLEPQPPAGSALWEGHTPGDGAVYVNPCIWQGPGSENQDVLGRVFWSQDAPAPAVDPAVLARRAVDSMLLDGPAIVSPRPGGTYTVGVPMWLWVGQGPTTWGPNVASASAGGITVTATAKVSSIVWSMGDGSSVTCTGPGTAYTAARGMAASPDCGHLYRATSAGRPGGKYSGTATSTWTVDWAVSGGGRTGQLTEVRQSVFTVAVGEVQVVGQ